MQGKWGEMGSDIADPDIAGRRRRLLKRTILAAALAALAVAAVIVNRPEPTRNGDAEYISAEPRQGAAIRLLHPFRGTPAAEWKDGITGLATPKIESVGDLSAAQVERAVQLVRRHIYTGYLDPRVIEKHEFTRILATLAPDARSDTRSELGTPLGASRYTVPIHQDFPLLPVSPKVRGSLVIRPGEESEQVRITVKMVVAYAFDIEDPDQIRDPLDIVSTVRADLTFRVLFGKGWVPSNRGLWLDEVGGYYYAINCEALRRGLLAPGVL